MKKLMSFILFFLVASGQVLARPYIQLESIDSGLPFFKSYIVHGELASGEAGDRELMSIVGDSLKFEYSHNGFVNLGASSFKSRSGSLLQALDDDYDSIKNIWNDDQLRELVSAVQQNHELQYFYIGLVVSIDDEMHVVDKFLIYSEQSRVLHVLSLPIYR